MLTRRFKWGICLLLISILWSNCQATPDIPSATMEQQTPVLHTARALAHRHWANGNPLPALVPQRSSMMAWQPELASVPNRDGNPEIYIMDWIGQVTRLIQ